MTYIYPEAFKAVGNSALARAFWLEQAAYAVQYEAIHGEGAPVNMSDEQRQGRERILTLAHDILIAASTRQIKQAINNYKAAGLE